MTFDPNNPAASGMVLTFDDEFTHSSISADNVASQTKWSDHVWWQQPPAQFAGSVHDGVLDLTQGAELNTVNSAGQGFGQKFGYFEARVKFGSPVGGGFFLMSQAHAQDGAQPASELDVIESQQGNPAGTPTMVLDTLHRDSAHPGDQQDAATGGNPFVDVGVDGTQAFHTYGALWDPHSNQITWYFDGKETMVQPKYDTTDAAQMFMDVLAGPQGGGHTYVDYVRAWQFSDQNPTAVGHDALSPAFGQAADNGSPLPGGPAVVQASAPAEPVTSPALPAAVAHAAAAAPLVGETFMTPSLFGATEVFSFSTLPPDGAANHIANFDPAHDALDLASLLQPMGYFGTDPLSDHAVAFNQVGDSTVVTVDPLGHNAAVSGTPVVTLDHVLPKDLSSANLWHG